MKRRDVIKLLGMSGATLAGCVHGGSDGKPSESLKSSSKRDEMVRIVILHTNDIHGQLLGWRGWEGALKDKMIGGAARLATAIGNARMNTPGTNMLLDAGDLIGEAVMTKLKALESAAASAM